MTWAICDSDGNIINMMQCNELSARLTADAQGLTHISVPANFGDLHFYDYPEKCKIVDGITLALKD